MVEPYWWTFAALMRGIVTDVEEKRNRLRADSRRQSSSPTSSERSWGKPKYLKISGLDLPCQDASTRTQSGHTSFELVPGSSQPSKSDPALVDKCLKHEPNLSAAPPL